MSKLENAHWGDVCERVDTCALTGAAAFVAGIPRTEILVNGPLWCYFYALRYLEHGSYDMAQRFHGSQPDNTAVVYGSEKYILAALKRLQKEGREPELLFIESSCSMSLIGDDLNGIAAKAALSCPYVTMDCGGLIGGFVEGYTKAALSVLDKCLELPAQTQKQVINILGQTDFYLHGRDDTEEMVRLLQKAGYKVQAVPGSGSSIDELKHLGNAQLNIVTNEELGLPLAEYLKKRCGTPYILAGLPYGIEGTKRWLARIDDALPAPEPGAVYAEAEFVAEHLTSLLNDARCQWGDLWADRIIISGPPTQALCLGEAVRREWVDTSELWLCCQRKLPHNAPEAYCKAADAIFISGEIDIPWKDIAQFTGSLLLMGSSSESSLLYRQGRTDFINCNIAFPAKEEIYLTKQPLVGLEGSKQLVQKIWNAYIRQCIQKQGES